MKISVVSLVNRARNYQPELQHRRVGVKMGINFLTGRIVKHCLSKLTLQSVVSLEKSSIRHLSPCVEALPSLQLDLILKVVTRERVIKSLTVVAG